MTLGFIHEITARCNLACAFCYNPWPRAALPPELDVETNRALLERLLGESRASWLTFAGGEPLMYEGLERVMTSVHTRFPKVRLGLATNSRLLPGRLEGLLAAGLGHVEISLFAHEAQSFKRLAGRDGHGDAPHAIALARARGLSVTAATVLRRGMEDELAGIIRMAHAVGAERLALNRFVARGRGMDQAPAFQPSLEELDSLLGLADRLAGQLGFPVVVTTPVEDCLLPHRRYPHLTFGPCVCARSKWAIDPEGNLRCCELDDRRLGSLRERSFRELARTAEAEACRQAHRMPACGTCAALPQCGGGCRFTPGTNAPGTAHSEHGGGRE